MSIENFTTYTETDPLSHLTVTSSRITFTQVSNDEDTYVHKDKGVNYFNGDFTFTFDVNVSEVTTMPATGGGRWIPIIPLVAVTNDVDDVYNIQIDNKPAIYCFCSDNSIGQVGYVSFEIVEVSGGSRWTAGPIGGSYNTTYYLKIERLADPAYNPGYESIAIYVYSDAARTNLVGWDFHQTNNPGQGFRYIFGLTSYNLPPQVPDGNESLYGSGYLENLDIGEVDSAVTTQACTNVTPLTATANGTVTLLGVPAATQHGHCWNITGLPTTADSKTTNGVPSLGAFTSSMTGLSAGIKYYVRAYITNANGTFYGSQVTFSVYPTDLLLRVSGITRTFWAGKTGQEGVYQSQINIGGSGASYIPPVVSKDLTPTIPSAEQPKLPPPIQGWSIQGGVTGNQGRFTPNVEPIAVWGTTKKDYDRWLLQTPRELKIAMFGRVMTQDVTDYMEWLRRVSR